MDFDLIIKRGTVYDGTGSPGCIMDIGIKDDKIASIDYQLPENNCPIIIAEGMAIAPGFIDIHSHSDFLWLNRPESDSKIFDGVTTEVCGNCGLSAFPLRGKVLEKRQEGLARYDIAIDWQSAAEFFDMAAKVNSSINRAFLVGHGNIRACTIEYEKRRPDSNELLRMGTDVENAMKAGAFGMSSGLIYPPGCYASTDELIELCKVVHEYGGIYASHVRNEGDRLNNAISEAIKIAKDSGVTLQISHVKTMGKQNWHKVDQIKSLIAQAQEANVNVTCDRYPYTAAATDLDVVLPQWVYEGGTKRQLMRLKNSSVREKIIQEMSKTYNNSYWDDIMISSVFFEKNRWMEGKTVSEIGTCLEKSPIDTILDLLIEEETRVDIFLFNMCENNLEKILRWDFVFIGSDSAMRTHRGVLSESKPHPRSYGTFSRVLGKYCREKNLFSLESAIQKMTSLPAQKIGLEKRGAIKEGYFADIVVFSPEIITDKSTYTQPHQYSEGIAYVIVNGKITVNKNKHVGLLNGQILKKT